MLKQSYFKKWLYALKLGAWPKVLVPALFGQAFGVFTAGKVSGPGFLWAMVFTVLFLIYLVLLNDWGDRQVDRIKRQLFPEGCSPKTIPDRILPAPVLLKVGCGGACLAMLAAWAGGHLTGRPWFVLGGLLSIGIFQAYTFAPLKLNYRGGGELLEMVGTGIVMPWLHAYLQSGYVWHPVYGFLVGFSLLTLASSLASGLADEESDMVGGKRTFATMLGNRWIRHVVNGLLWVSLAVWSLTAWLLQSYLPWLSILLPGIILLYQNSQMRRVSPLAVTRAFEEQKQYKAHLHRAIWYSTSALALILLGLGFR